MFGFARGALIAFVVIGLLNLTPLVNDTWHTNSSVAFHFETVAQWALEQLSASGFKAPISTRGTLVIGVVGIFGRGNVNQALFDALNVLQHRGQDAAYGDLSNGKFHLRKDNGLVRDVFRMRHMQYLIGNMGLAMSDIRPQNEFIC